MLLCLAATTESDMLRVQCQKYINILVRQTSKLADHQSSTPAPQQTGRPAEQQTSKPADRQMFKLYTRKYSLYDVLDGLSDDDIALQWNARKQSIAA